MELFGIIPLLRKANVKRYLTKLKLYASVTSNKQYQEVAMPVVRVSEQLFKEIQKYAEPLVDDFESTLWKILKKADPNLVLNNEVKTPIIKGDTTPQVMFWRPVLESLVELGGEAPANKVVEKVEKTYTFSWLIY